MLNTNIDYAQFPGCPIRNVLSRIGDKWSMLVLYTLDKYGVLRFKDLMLYIPDISKKMLSTALKVLEGVRGVAVHHFHSSDVVRHPLVQKIVKAYEEYEKKTTAKPRGTGRRKRS